MVSAPFIGLITKIKPQSKVNIDKTLDIKYFLSSLIMFNDKVNFIKELIIIYSPMTIGRILIMILGIKNMIIPGIIKARPTDNISVKDPLLIIILSPFNIKILAIPYAIAKLEILG